MMRISICYIKITKNNVFVNQILITITKIKLQTDKFDIRRSFGKYNNFAYKWINCRRLYLQVRYYIFLLYFIRRKYFFELN